MHLSLRILGIDVIDLDLTTDDGKPPPRESDIGIAAVIDTSPARTGFDDRATR